MQNFKELSKQIWYPELEMATAPLGHFTSVTLMVEDSSGVWRSTNLIAFLLSPKSHYEALKPLKESLIILRNSGDGKYYLDPCNR